MGSFCNFLYSCFVLSPRPSDTPLDKGGRGDKASNSTPGFLTQMGLFLPFFYAEFSPFPR